MLQGNVKSTKYQGVQAATENYLDVESLRKELQSYKALNGNRPYSRYTVQSGEDQSDPKKYRIQSALPEV